MNISSIIKSVGFNKLNNEGNLPQVSILDSLPLHYLVVLESLDALLTLLCEEIREKESDAHIDGASNSVEIVGWVEHGFRVVLGEVYRVVLRFYRGRDVLAVDVVH